MNYVAGVTTLQLKRYKICLNLLVSNQYRVLTSNVALLIKKKILMYPEFLYKLNSQKSDSSYSKVSRLFIFIIFDFTYFTL